MKKTVFMFLTLSMAFLVLVVFPTLSFAGEPRYGGTLRIGVRMPQHNRLDPRDNTLENFAPASGMIYDCLFNWGEDGFKNLVPQLATGYETQDNMTWIIHLRKGVKFHNGREMTAEDVKANLDWRITLPQGWKPIKFKEFIKYLKAVEVVDPYTVKIILEQPFSPLLRILAYSLRGIVPPEEVEKWGEDFSNHPCGTGPFKVVEIKPREKIVLERFNDYWGPKPYVDRIEYIVIGNNDARVIALEKGEIHIAQQIQDESLPIIKKNAALAYKEAMNPFVLHKHYFNFRRWPGNDIRFRKALWMGADWKNIAINSRAFKSGLYAGTLLNRSDFYNPAAMDLVPGYNPEEAKKLIQAVEKDAGKKIPPIFWLDSNRSAEKMIGEAAKTHLSQIGVTVNLQLLSHALWFEKGYRDTKVEWDTFGYGLGFGLEPSQGFQAFITNSGTHVDGKSIGGYANPEFDRYIAMAEKAGTEDERVKAYQKAEEILLKDIACIPIINYRAINAYSKKLQGFIMNNTTNIYATNSFTNVWLEE